jgi:hypothetical protein
LFDDDYFNVSQGLSQGNDELALHQGLTGHSPFCEKCLENLQSLEVLFDGMNAF